MTAATRPPTRSAARASPASAPTCGCRTSPTSTASTSPCWGCPFDTATSFRAGARFGPEAIRSASALLRPYNPEQQVDIFAHLSAVDAGDLPIAPGDTEATYALVEEGLAPIVAAGVFPVVLGGDHSITLAELRALHRRHGPMALVHLDAHGDTWHEYFGQRYYHGTTFRRAAEEGVIDPAASVQAGMRGSLYGPEDITAARELGFTVLSTRELRELGAGGLRRSRPRPRRRPAGVPHLRRRLLRPGVRARHGHARGRRPELVGGARVRARAARRSASLGCDVVEVAPPYDSPGQPTALLGATIAWEAISLHARARAAVAEARG